MSSLHHIFLTGQPGVGKTTLLKKLVEIMKERKISISGFYTEEVRNNCNRIGFDVVSLCGMRFPLARVEDGNRAMKRPKVGRYSVYVNDFDENLVSLLPTVPCVNANIVFIDEVGKMELLSMKFKKKIVKLLDDKSLLIIGTIPIKKGSGIPFVESIRNRDDVMVFNVSYDNRDVLVHDILKEVHFSNS